MIVATTLATPGQAKPVRVGHIRAELIPEVTAIQPGRPFTVGLRLQMDQYWHIYWRNPGDAGLPPKLTWSIPDGFTAGAIEWPYPEQYRVPPLTTYGYHGEVVLPVTITPPSNLQPGASIVLRARAEWLVCRQACVPGKADLTLTLPVAANAPSRDTAWAAAFSEARRNQPLANSDWSISAEVADSMIKIELRAPDGYKGGLDSVLFLPYDAQVIDYDAPQLLSKTGNGYRLEIRRSDYSTSKPERISGILLRNDGWQGSKAAKALAIDVPTGVDSSATKERSKASGSADHRGAH